MDTAVSKSVTLAMENGVNLFLTGMKMDCVSLTQMTLIFFLKINLS